MGDLVIKDSLLVKGGDITGDGGSPADIINMQKGALALLIDGGGSEIGTGYAGQLRVPANCIITSVDLLAAPSGSIVVDIWVDTIADYPPTVADTITASAKPTITSADKASDASLTGWSKTLNAGDIIFFNVDSCTTITSCLVNLNVRKL